MSRKSKRGSAAPVPESKSGRPALKIAAACFAVAAAIAGYLFWYSITEKPMAGCGPGSPCDRVMGSSWAYWLNIPVSGPALATYLGLLVCALAANSKRSDKAWNLGLLLSIFVVATALWFVFLQVQVLKSVCKFCTTTHLFAVLGAVLFLFNAPRPGKWRTSRNIALTAIGLMLFGSVIAGQKLVPHKTNVVSIYSGKFQFNLRDIPVIGNPDNKAYIISLFDYTCPDCHDMHALLKTALERKTNSFSIITLPVPLDSNCNPTVRETRAKHKDACVYARIGLAMRRCGADFYKQYDDWFFSAAGKRPALETAREKAIELAGKEKFELALADPWVEETLRKGIDIYLENGRATRSYRMPQLIIGDMVNAGPISGINELMTMLETRLHASPTLVR